VYTELKVSLGDININASQLKPVHWLIQSFKGSRHV